MLILKIRPQYLNMELSTDLKVTPLSRAVWRNDFQLFKMLLEVGADINEGGEEGITPLMWAAKRDHLELLF